jgi:hypothetical protein
MEWISVKNEFPPFSSNGKYPFVLAYHTIYGIGVAWFWILEDMREELEDDFKDKYLCSCQFIKNIPDGNYSIDDDDDIDIFMKSPHFKNLGTVTHWQPLPSPPKD